jgi:hypothetical protein
MSLEGDDVSEDPDPPQALRKMVKTNKRRQLFIMALSLSEFVEKHSEFNTSLAGEGLLGTNRHKFI